MAKKMFDSRLSEADKQRVHQMYHLNMEPVEIARQIETEPIRVKLEINAYERELESKSYVDRMAARLAAMI